MKLFDGNFWIMVGLLVLLAALAFARGGVPLVAEGMSGGTRQFLRFVLVLFVSFLVAGLVEQLVPSARLTEGLTWVTTGLSLGFALGSPVTGVVVDTAGPAAGFWVGLAAAVAATSTVFAARGSWGPQPAPA